MTTSKKLFAALVVLIISGCTEQVPPGYIGMRMTSKGIESAILPAGRHEIYGRDRLVLLETKEQMNTETLAILCKDDLNFAFDLKIRAMLDARNVDVIRDVLNRQGANIKWDGGTGLLEYDGLYATYVQPLARSVARAVVSRYMTTEIRDNRDKIQKEILRQLSEGLKGTPMSLQMVATSNFDYPEIITKAVEKKRQRELQIQEERANREIELEQARNRKEIALEMKAVRVAEAEAEAAYNQVFGASITSNYLRKIELENQRVLYENAEDVQLVITDGKSPMIPIFQR